MRRLIDVLGASRTDLNALVTQHSPLYRIEEAYELFANQRYGVLKVAMVP